MFSPIARLLRLASVLCCLIVAASFVLFALDKTQGASDHQQVLLGGRSASSAATAPADKHQSSERRALDDAADTITSPFDGLASGSSSEWAERLLRLVLTLAVYGFGLGFLARVLRVRL